MAGKRPYSHYDPGPSDKSHKRHQPSSFRGRNNGSSSSGGGAGFSREETVFRLLCPSVKLNSVIGKGGAALKSLRLETGARIRIEEPVHGSDERVILISAGSADDNEPDEDAGAAGAGAAAAAAAAGGFTILDRDDRGIEDYTFGREVSASQLALFKIHARLLDADKLLDEERDEDEGYSDEERGSSSKVVLRMLVPESQVGCLLGKRGRIIEQMREETGSQIRILPREQLPACALATDEVVQVVGEKLCVKKALCAISTRLLDNPPKDRNQQFSGGASNYNRGGPYNSNNDSFTPRNSSFGSSHQGFRNSELDTPGYQLLRPTAAGMEYGGRHIIPSDEELVFRILCPEDKIGSIIGKAGSIVQQLRDDTGAKIKVADPIHGSDERVIIVSAVEFPDEDLSPAQEAVFHIQDRMRDGMEAESVTTRLLVPSNQVGCLLGKGGNIISEMRKQTRANIRVFSKDQLPTCALDNDEIVQIIGEIRVARDALVRITSRLRENLYREKDGRAEEFGAAFQQKSSSPGAYPPFAIPGAQPPRPMQFQSDRGIPGLGLGSFNSFSGLNLPAASLPTPLGSSIAANVTSTRIEVRIPEAAVTAVGVNGSNLQQICKISGAKINFVDGGMVGAGKVIEIAGTPDQTSLAKNLVDAFFATGGGQF